MTRSTRSWMAIGALLATSLAAGSAGATMPASFVTKINASVKLGTATATAYAAAITQSPTTNDVYVGDGSKVLVVVGDSAAKLFLTAPAKVLALCATGSDLFVETSSSVLEYTLPSGGSDGTWPLPSGLGPSKDTQAGISVEGNHLWTWTDWETDESGYEYGSVVNFNTSIWSSVVLDKGQVDPGDATASSLGYYFLANDRVVRAESSGAVVKSVKTSDASDAPLAIEGDHLYLVATREPSGADYLDVLNATTLAKTSSVPLASITYSILGTPLGLVAIHAHGSDNTVHSVVLVNPTTGAETDPLSVPGAQALLYGTTLSAVADVNGVMYLDRLS